jgi:hypothetical protein
MRKVRKNSIPGRRRRIRGAANRDNHLNSDIKTIGESPFIESVGFGSTSIHLHGKTVANYDNGTGTTKNLKVVSDKDCSGCADSECVTVSGIFSLTFRANPTINLPSPSEYAHLRPCQQERVKAWIQNVLLPHERQHKAAFELYNGTVNKPFNMKICRSEWSADLLQPIHDAENNRRKKVANDASDALDPFHTNIDLDCEDKETITDGNAYVP